MHSPYPPSSPSTTPISNHQNRPICYPWPFPSSIKQDQRSVNCLHRSDERDEYHHCLNFILYTHPPPPTFKRPRPRLPSPPSHFLPPPGYLNGQLQLLQAMKFIEDICEGIVSPPKLRYSTFDLGSAMSSAGRRHDFQVLNAKGLRIQASFYQHVRRDRPCVVYLHSMNGSRLQSTSYAQMVLQMGLSFCNFDFTGCGNSEGTAISFGANEKQDILTVLDSLGEKWGIRQVVLWGRSMGAASAIKYCELVQTYRLGQASQEVLGVILDSCFRSFDQLAMEIAHTHSQVPAFILRLGYYFIRGTLEEKGGFRIEELELQEVMGRLSVPTLFLTSPDDTTVRSQHSVALYNRCVHDLKRLTYIRGLHNQSRDQHYIGEVKIFIEELLAYRSRSGQHQRANNFERIASERRNFSVEGELQGGEDCGCSLFLPSQQPERSLPPTSRRKQSEPTLQRIKLNRIPSSNRYNFRSTQQVPQVSTFEIPL